MNLKVVIHFVVLVALKCTLRSNAFSSIDSLEILPGETHRTITVNALYQVYAQYSQDHPEEELPPVEEHHPFNDAVDDIENAVSLVDIDEGHNESAHFDCEQFSAGHRRIRDGIQSVLASIQAGNFADARNTTGAFLHTLQDFYSHTNWLELGNRAPNPDIINSDTLSTPIADPDERTCDNCTIDDDETCSTSSSFSDCTNNVVTESLTSGYAAYCGVKPVGKCSHSGNYLGTFFFLKDTTQCEDAIGGINKDFTDPSLSPHAALHNQAAQMATDASVDLFAYIRETLADDELFAAYLNIIDGALSIVVDTTAGMAGEMEKVKSIVKDLVDQVGGNSHDTSTLYVLTPANEGDNYGPTSATIDRGTFADMINLVQPEGNGSASQFHGLYLASQSTPAKQTLFLFTNQEPGDLDFAEEAMTQLASKEHTVVVALCESLGTKKRSSPEGLRVYEEIARNTGGFVLRASVSDDVARMADFLSKDAKERRATVLSVDTLETNVVHPLKFSVDPFAQSIVVLVSTPAEIISFDLQDPHGSAASYARVVRRSRNNVALKIDRDHILPGEWTATLSCSSSECSARVLVRSLASIGIQLLSETSSPFDANSENPFALRSNHPGLEPMRSNPVIGAPYVAAVNVRYPKSSNIRITVDSIEVVARSGTAIATYPLTSTLAAKIDAPSEAFHFVVNGHYQLADGGSLSFKRALNRTLTPAIATLHFPSSLDVDFSAGGAAKIPFSLTAAVYGTFEIAVSDDAEITVDFEPKLATLFSKQTIHGSIALMPRKETKSSAKVMLSVVVSETRSGKSVFMSKILTLKTYFSYS